jgi:hypothetical protein
MRVHPEHPRLGKPCTRCLHGQPQHQVATARRVWLGQRPGLATKRQVSTAPGSVPPARRLWPVVSPCPHETMQSTVKILISYDNFTMVSNSIIHSKKNSQLILL